MKGRMKSKRTKGARRHAKLLLKLSSWGNYIDEAYQLESLLAKKPVRLKIEFVGSGEIPPDSALLMRSTSCWRVIGVFSTAADCSIPLMWPTSVLIPVAVTSISPLPRVTSVFMKAMSSRSPRGTSEAVMASMLFSTAAGLSAWSGSPAARKEGFICIAFLMIGGFVLGPLMQWYGFNAWWTGIPFGYDLTDNKTLLAGVAWLWAAFQMRGGRPARTAIILAAVTTLVVFAIPHSAWGSEFKWDSVPAGTR